MVLLRPCFLHIMDTTTFLQLFQTTQRIEVSHVVPVCPYHKLACVSRLYMPLTDVQ